eukprot:scaffold432625_cov19-Prasinocladus_malaysianus.AAC.1
MQRKESAKGRAEHRRKRISKAHKKDERPRGKIKWEKGNETKRQGKSRQDKALNNMNSECQKRRNKKRKEEKRRDGTPREENG